MELPVINPPEGALPPEEVRIRSMAVDVQTDRRRIRISIELTPFQSPPDLAVVITDHNRRELVSTNIIGAMNNKLMFTMHLPELAPSNECLLHAAVEYQQQGRTDEMEKAFSLASTSSEAED